jgi:hypothetical protein
MKLLVEVNFNEFPKSWTVVITSRLCISNCLLEKCTENFRMYLALGKAITSSYRNINWLQILRRHLLDSSPFHFKELFWVSTEFQLVLTYP